LNFTLYNYMESGQSFLRFMENKNKILAIKDSNEFSGSELVTTPPSSHEHLPYQDRIRKKGQGKLLLVALLENYCMLYDQSKEQNQKLFLVLCQHLCRMGIIDSTDFLEEFSSVRSSYKKAFKELVLLAMDTVKDMDQTRGLLLETDPDEGLEIIRTPSSALLHQPSIPIPASPTDFTEFLESGGLRFEEEFEIVDIIGRGAFGKVFHTRNLLDSQSYAVKMIKTPHSGGSSLIKTLREVKLLANLSHTNVVRYYSSWMQHMSHKVDYGSENDDSYYEQTTMSEEFSAASTTNQSTSIENASLHSISSHEQHLFRSKELVLFIQMELCDNTLHNWLEQLNHSFISESFRRIEEKILHCMVDLLKGVQFIHKKGYIHRDLKPKNIYWKPDIEDGSKENLGDQHGHWKIGDFGLATLAHAPKEDSNRQRHSLGVGTITYASPEQLNDHFEHSYSYQTDIYSLGIILFELLVPMKTGMERAEKLNQLRQGSLPEEFLASRPKEVLLSLCRRP
jgi:eukaryotic translation initiation factor 2-alpha kinase 1